MCSTRFLALRIPYFYAAIASKMNPELKGKAFVVCQSGGSRGQVLGVSPLAAESGILPGVLLGYARKSVPDLQEFVCTSEMFESAADRILRSLSKHTPTIQQSSTSQFLLDLRGCEHLHPDERQLAIHLLENLQSDESLTAAIGTASSALGAQLIARRATAGQIHSLGINAERQMLDSFPLKGLPGLSVSMISRLAELGIHFVSDARNVPAEQLRQIFASSAEKLLQLLSQLDNSPKTDSQNSENFTLKKLLKTDSSSLSALWYQLFELVESGHSRIAAKNLCAARLLLKATWSDGHSILRGDTIAKLPGETDLQSMRRVARKLLERICENRRLRLRQLELCFTNLEAANNQISLFSGSAEKRENKMNRTLQQIRLRFGQHSVRQGICA
jgi:nucleotidyltransferase/DNA polymerase involved in DNA repair